MGESRGLPAGETILLDDGVYLLEENVGEGGSSVVYLARPMSDQNTPKGDYVVIKEFHPWGYNITRDSGKNHLLPEACADEIEKLRKRAYRESDIIKDIRDERSRSRVDGKSDAYCQGF